MMLPSAAFLNDPFAAELGRYADNQHHLTVR
jgi:hypothetical protein